MDRRLFSLVLASVLLLGFASRLRGDGCEVRFDDKGPASIVHNGVTLVHADAPRFRAQCLRPYGVASCLQS